jgi:H+/Cl- antiporter ClcA
MLKIVKILIIAALVGLVSGLLSSSFLHLLEWVTLTRKSAPFLIWGLPVFGLLFGLCLKKMPHHINQGVPYILQELENDQAKVSPWMTPFIFLSSLMTHLFGGSAGREGVGVIMGASAAHLLPKFHASFLRMRPYLIYSGIAAGFSSIFGTPLAAIIFSFELHAFKHIKRWDLVVCTSLASFIALIIPDLLGPGHQAFIVNFTWDFSLLMYLLLAGLASGVAGQIFYWGLLGYTRFISFLFPRIEWKLLIGGLLISFLVYFANGHDYIGIGTDMIGKSFVSEREPFDFLMKALLTIMTLAIGFKGGEVTPLFFMGATFSNSIASFLKFRNFGLSSALGMVGLFGAVTGTPIASAIMAGELFGAQTGVIALGSCWLARFLMLGRSVYRH